jgi:hypothetical protein
MLKCFLQLDFLAMAGPIISHMKENQFERMEHKNGRADFIQFAPAICSGLVLERSA